MHMPCVQENADDTVSNGGTALADPQRWLRQALFTFTCGPVGSKTGFSLLELATFYMYVYSAQSGPLGQ